MGSQIRCEDQKRIPKKQDDVDLEKQRRAREKELKKLERKKKCKERCSNVLDAFGSFLQYGLDNSISYTSYYSNYSSSSSYYTPQDPVYTGKYISKLDAMKKMVKKTLKRMLPNDSASLVVFDTSSEVLVEPMLVKDGALEHIVKCLEKVDTRGGTTVSQALEAGVETARRAQKKFSDVEDEVDDFINSAEVEEAIGEMERGIPKNKEDDEDKNHNNNDNNESKSKSKKRKINRMCRVMLITDMQTYELNQGLKSLQEISVSAANEEGIFLTYVGVGEDFNHSLTEKITIAPACNYFCIEHFADFKERIAKQLTRCFFPVVKSMGIQIVSHSCDVVEIVGAGKGSFDKELLDGWKKEEANLFGEGVRLAVQRMLESGANKDVIRMVLENVVAGTQKTIVVENSVFPGAIESLGGVGAGWILIRFVCNVARMCVSCFFPFFIGSMRRSLEVIFELFCGLKVWKESYTNFQRMLPFQKISRAMKLLQKR